MLSYWATCLQCSLISSRKRDADIRQSLALLFLYLLVFVFTNYISHKFEFYVVYFVRGRPTIRIRVSHAKNKREPKYHETQCILRSCAIAVSFLSIVQIRTFAAEILSLKSRRRCDVCDDRQSFFVSSFALTFYVWLLLRLFRRKRKEENVTMVVRFFRKRRACGSTVSRCTRARAHPTDV